MSAQVATNFQFNSDRIEISGAYMTYDPSTYNTLNSWTVPVSSPYNGLVFTLSNDPAPNTLYAVSSAYLVDPSIGRYVLTLKNLSTNDIYNVSIQIITSLCTETGEPPFVRVRC